MSMVDDLLGPLVEHIIDDGEGGQWVVAIRPRCSGPRITRSTVVRFRRPERRNGFGIRLHVLQEMARDRSAWPVPTVETTPSFETTLNFTETAALNALTWINELKEEKD